jgi:tRNA threonylcarbamoyl adenosine modification protein YeaZ
MRILGLDTTTGSGSVALLENTRLLAEINAESALTHSARLLRAVDFLLKKNGLEIKDVDGFAVAAGPGSFTGIRIGLSTVKAFAFASGIEPGGACPKAPGDTGPLVLSLYRRQKGGGLRGALRNPEQGP